MTVNPLITPLTDSQKHVAALLVYGKPNEVIATEIHLSMGGVASRLTTARKKLGIPGCSRPVLVHALLAARQIPSPACGRPAPDFTAQELKMLRTLAEHTRSGDIGHAIGLRASDVRAEVDALVAKACADNTAHLVGLAHTWGILGDPSNSQLTRAAATAGPA